MSDRVIKMDTDRVQELLCQFKTFVGNTQEVIQNTDNHIDGKMDYFQSVEAMIRKNLDEAEQKLREAEEELNDAEADLSSCERSQRYDEERGCYVPSCHAEANRVNRCQKIVNECRREVDRWQARLDKCKQLIRRAQSAVNEYYNNGKRLMHNVFTESTPHIEHNMMVILDATGKY